MTQGSTVVFPLNVQYVALAFYLELLNGDAPQLAAFLSTEENKCVFDGTHGAAFSGVSKKVVRRGESIPEC